VDEEMKRSRAIPRLLYKPFDAAELLGAIQAAVSDSPQDDSAGVSEQFEKG
jgi:hypothetical protein